MTTNTKIEAARAMAQDLADEAAGLATAPQVRDHLLGGHCDAGAADARQGRNAMTRRRNDPLYEALDGLLLAAWGRFNRHDGRLPADVAARFAAAARAAHVALDTVDGGRSATHLEPRFTEIQRNGR